MSTMRPVDTVEAGFRGSHGAGGRDTMTKRTVSVAAASAVLLAAGCSSSGNDVDPVTAASASASVSQPSAPEPAARLTVLGDSNASPTSCFRGCTVFATQVATALRDAVGGEVELVNLAWELSNPEPAQMADLAAFVRTNQRAREALAASDAVLIYASQNDLAYNRRDDPCGVSGRYPRVQWQQLTHACMDSTTRDYRRHLQALLNEIDTLRGGKPTMLRIVTAINTTIGDLVDPTWNSPAAIEPSVYNVGKMSRVQCALAEQHGGRCADALHAFNGKDGRQSAQSFLNPADATHLFPSGHDLVAHAVIELGFQPLS